MFRSRPFQSPSGSRRQAEELVEVFRADPALPRDVEVHGRDTRHGLRDGERFGLLLERFLELLARRHVGDGADEPGGLPVRPARDLAARGQPAHAPVECRYAVLGVEVETARDGVAQCMYHRLEVLAMHRRQPVVAVEGQPVRGNPHDLKKRGVASIRPLLRSRSNMPNPPAHCAKRRNSAERCSSDSRAWPKRKALRTPSASASSSSEPACGGASGSAMGASDALKRRIRRATFTAEANAAAAIARARTHATTPAASAWRGAAMSTRQAPPPAWAGLPLARRSIWCESAHSPCVIRSSSGRSPSRHLSAG